MLLCVFRKTHCTQILQTDMNTPKGHSSAAGWPLPALSFPSKRLNLGLCRYQWWGQKDSFGMKYLYLIGLCACLCSFAKHFNSFH